MKVGQDPAVSLGRATFVCYVLIGERDGVRFFPNRSLPFLVRCRRSSTRYGQDRHYLHGFAWEDCEVRMVFEQLRGRLV
jgi:hypothetical protein